MKLFYLLYLTNKFIQIILDKRKLKGVSKKDTIIMAIKLCKIERPKNSLAIIKIATNKATAIP